MDITEELKKVGLTCEQYEACMSDISDKLNGIVDLDWEEIRAKYNLAISTDTLRHSQARPFGGAFVREYFNNEVDVPSSYVEQMENIRKEKQKLSDERCALKKISRDSSRIEADLDYLASLISNTSYANNFSSNCNLPASDSDLLICCSDVHFGLDAHSNFGSYNSEIAAERMNQYFEEILRIQKTHDAENAYVFLGGDLLNGNIHWTTQLQNREDLVEQIQGVSELLSAFIFELSKHFNNVYVNGVSGNHSRVGLKDSVLRSERMDDLIPWYLQAKLSMVENIHMLSDNYDYSIAGFNIRGRDYIGVHGDYDAYSESGVNKLVAMVGFRPEAILYGHLHKCSYDDISNVKIIRSGSFAGTVDDYTISKRIVGRPSQMVCVVGNEGVKTLYPVDLT